MADFPNENEKSTQNTPIISRRTPMGMPSLCRNSPGICKLPAVLNPVILAKGASVRYNKGYWKLIRNPLSLH
jgi:hypothetical protein